jgi:uncharacterized protein YhaN
VLLLISGYLRADSCL